MAQDEEDVHDTVFGRLLVAAAFLVLGWLLQGEFAKLESGQVGVWWIAAFPYRKVGRP